jgi:nitrite reductase/ring-hydroxylating ferredoxin subunit
MTPVRHEVGRVEEFELNKCRIFEVEGRSIGVFRLDDGFYALNNVCPHMRAPICRGYVEGTYLPSAAGEFVFGMEASVLSCPWHAWEYDIRTGLPLFGIDRRRVRTYPVVVEDDRVLVEVPR